MTVVQNVARDPSGNAVRATVTIRLIAGDVTDINVPGFVTDGTVIGTHQLHTDDDGFWSVDLDPNSDYLPTGTFYEFAERPAGTRATYVYYGEVPDVAGPVDLIGILVDPVEEPDSLYLLATQKGAAGGLATLDEDGQVPADQLGNVTGGGGGGAVDSVFGRTGAVTAQSGDYTKAQVGLSNVDNTADASKPVSTLQAAADTAVANAAAAALAAHEADTTSVHGIPDTSALATATDVTTAVSAHVAASDPHGDRAFATTAVSTHEADTTNVHGITDTSVLVTSSTLTSGLAGKQDLDADLTTIAAIDSTVAGVLATDGTGWIRKTYAALKTALGLVKADVGLGNVDNTSDADKPISTAQQSALDLKANLASPTFTGTPSLPTGTTGVTQSAADSSTKLATTAFVTTADNLKANLASPTFTGTPAAPTASQGTNTTQLATTAYVQTEVGLLIPKSLADAKGDIFVATADNTVARLAVGSNDQVLTADSTQSTGVKWATSAAGTPDSERSYPKTGLWYRAPQNGPANSSANLTLVQNTLYLVPFRVGLAFTADRIGFELVTVSAANGVCRLGIFNADTTNYLPGTLVLDAGTIQVSSGTGSKPITISQALSVGVYWLGIVLQTAAGAVVRACVANDPLVPYYSGASAITGTESASSVLATGITGALASTPTISNNDRGPLLSVRCT